MQKKIYTILFSAILITLLFPVIQEIGRFSFWSLEGYVAPIETVEFSFKNYRNGSYQEYCRQLAKEKLGFKTLFVRTYNQFLYTCFKKISNQNLLRGEAGHYYLKQYTDDATGITLQQKYGTIDSARRAAQQNITKTLKLIDQLKQHNTHLLIVLAPSKTIIYPEFLPDSIQKKLSPFSLQEEYARLYKAHNIPCLDFIPIFKQWKETSDFPLYTYYGTHWNAGTLPFVCDTLLRRIAEVSQCDLPTIQYGDSNISKRYRLKSDYELEATANLLFRMKRIPIPNPTFELTKKYQKKRPKLLMVADSYYSMIQQTAFEEAFEVVDYWKYNKEAYSSTSAYGTEVPLLDRHKIITEADIVVVMFTSIFSYDYLFSFAESVQQILDRGKDYNIELEIQRIIEQIKATPSWYKNVKKQAKERNISLEENLIDNAKYVLIQRGQEL